MLWKVLKSDSIDKDGISKMHMYISHFQLLFQNVSLYFIRTWEFSLWHCFVNLKRGKSPTDCSCYRPITVSCNISKVFEYILLPFLTKNIIERENQFGFRYRVGCQHAHKIMYSLLADNSSMEIVFIFVLWIFRKR